METEKEQAPTVADQLAAIEKRVERIQFFTAWMLAVIVLAAIAGLITGIVIANGISDLAGPSWR